MDDDIFKQKLNIPDSVFGQGGNMTVSQGPPVNDPMGRAFFRYEASLSDEERRNYRRTATTAEDLEREVIMLQTKHKKLSKTLRIATCIEPLVSFLQRHRDRKSVV